MPSPGSPVRDTISIQDIALSPGAHRDAPVLSPKVQLQGQGLRVVPGVEPSTTPPRHPARAPSWEVSGSGMQGSTGRGAHRRKAVLQHALHQLGHLREEQTLHQPVGVPGGRTAQASHHPTQDAPRAPGSPRAPPAPCPEAPGRSPVVELNKAPAGHNEGVS